MKGLLAALLVLLASAAQATVDAWPALYDVAGVASDDVLNIRAAPDAGADILGSLAPAATDVEVIRVTDSEAWGLVNTGERRGWVSMAYMARQDGQWAGRYPPITACYGTEPFWDLIVTGDTIALSMLGATAFPAVPAQRTQSANRLDRFGLLARGLTGVLREEACNDGMSDRAFGLSIDLLVPVEGQWRQLSGCCTLQPD